MTREDIKKEFNDMVATLRREKGMTYQAALAYTMEYHLDLHEKYLVAVNPHMELDQKKIEKWRKKIKSVTE